MEQLSQESVTVTVIINTKQYTFDKRKVTGLDIKNKASQPSNSELYRKEGDHLSPEIGNDQTIEIHDGEEFAIFPPTPVS